MGCQNRWTVENAGHIMNIRSQPFRQFYDFVPFFSYSLIFCKTALLGESKIKIGSQTEWKASLFHWFFSLFSFLLSLGVGSMESLMRQKPSVPSISRNIDLHPFFLINRGITEWEWGERSFLYSTLRMNNYLESSLSYYVKQNSNQPMKTNPHSINSE